MDHNHNPHLGVNKNSKSIRKSPLHQPNFHHQQQPQPPPPQPQVYNISKKDFRTIVQQLTGTPTRDPPSDGGNGTAPQPMPPARPPQPRPSSSIRLQRIRPPPLTPLSLPPPHPFQNPNPSFFPPRPSSAVAGSPVSAYMKYLESSLLHSDGRPTPQPVSAYMKYLESSLLHSDGRPTPQQFPPFHNPNPNPGLLPSPGSQFPQPFPAFPSPRGNPNANGPNPNMGLLPSPGLPPSPSSFLNLLSPKSPWPLLSPGFQYPPPLTPNFSFSPLAQNGILGPGPGPGSGSHPPLPSSPGLFPPSPSGFFPNTSPRWRDVGQ